MVDAAGPASASVAPRVRIGIVGWNYPEWKGLVYTKDAKPPDFLRQYAERFPTVEAASTAYGMPKKESVAAWAEAVPAGFELSVKVPDWILEKKPDDPDQASAMATFLGRLAPLQEAGKLGVVVAQFHPRWSREKHAAELAAFVDALPEGPQWAVELRHASWWHDDTYATLCEAGVTLVWSALAPPFRTPPVVTTRRLYLRLFGDRELEPPFSTKRRDARAEIAHWVEQVRAAADKVDRVDVLFSKYLEGYAPGSAATFRELLDAALPGAAVDPPQTGGARQTTLFG